MPSIRIALGQINPTVGDLEGNAQKVLAAVQTAENSSADLIVFPELCLSGYPPEDLLLRSDFVQANINALEKIAPYIEATAAVIGFPDRGEDGVFNSAALLHNGEWHDTYHKQELPNYSVFDERRNFIPGDGETHLYEVAGIRVGIAICEDAWVPNGHVKRLVDGGAELVVVINASPFYVGRAVERVGIMRERVRESPCSLVYVNAVGGQDELVFDGSSFVLDREGQLVVSAPQFSESTLVCDVHIEKDSRLHSINFPMVECSLTSRAKDRRWPALSSWTEDTEEMYNALVLGTADYVRKNGFTDVVIGLSGGIDSSIVACIAADAVGASHVHGVLMPSEFTSDDSNDYAEQLAQALSIDSRTIPIDSLRDVYTEALSESFVGTENDVTEENVQSRIRGNLLMALSNKFGWLVLTTGNKTELAVGYTTLYGDSAGGFGVIKDVLKTEVYELAMFRNLQPDAPIPSQVLSRAPTAELRPNQTDDQSLPPYDVLDPIVEACIEGDLGPADLLAKGFDPKLVTLVLRLIKGAEYKRRQMPPGVRVSPKAFGRDRRLPITNGYPS